MAGAVSEITKEEAQLCAITAARREVADKAAELEIAQAEKKVAQRSYDVALAKLLSVIDADSADLPLYDKGEND